MKKIFSIFILISIPFFAIGQISIPEGINDQISISLSNSAPSPNEFVSVKISSFSTNLKSSEIKWFLNNELKLNGPGATSYNFQVGDFGETTNLKIEIKKQDGTTFSKNYSFRPMEIDLFYEAESTVPKGYKGKALYGKQTSVKIFAEPRIINKDGQIIPKNQINYKWTINGFVVQDLSGLARDFIKYEGSLITRPLEVKVEAYTSDKTAYAKKTIVLNPVTGFSLFYEKNPTLGVMYEQAIQNSFELNRPEIELQAEDLYFSTNTNINRKWFINSQEIYSSEDLNSITFRNENNESGAATIRMTTQNNDKILQGSTSLFNLIFNNN